jgi:multiple sugar transport system permease protein
MGVVEEPLLGVAPAPRRRSGRLNPRWPSVLMVGPTVLALIAVLIVPLGYSFAMSLRSWGLTDINGAKPYVGLANYRELLHDSAFLGAFRTTFILIAASVTIELVLGFAVALALFHITRGRKLANALILLPMIVTPVIVALMWRYLLDPQFGVVNAALGVFGIKPVAWLGGPSTALLSIVIVDVWQWTPFVVLVLHAGMLALPPELLEAARVDGAGGRQLVLRIMVPLLAPLFLLVLLFRTMDVYRIFDTVYVLTQGGPGRATETVGIYTYKAGFEFSQMGYSMAMSCVVLVVILVISSFYLVLFRRARWAG